jgi:hypothetical protein
MLRFRTLNKSCTLLDLLPTKCSSCKMLQSSSSTMSSLSQMSWQDMRHTLRLELWCMTRVRRYDWSHDIDRSREVRPESRYTTWVIFFLSESGIQSESYLLNGVGHTTGVVPSNRSHIFRPESCIRSESCIRLESHLPTAVGFTTGVAPSDRSRAYDWSRVFRPELGIWPKSRIRPESYLSTRVRHRTEVAHTTRVACSDQSRAYDRSRVF